MTALKVCRLSFLSWRNSGIVSLRPCLKHSGVSCYSSFIYMLFTSYNYVFVFLSICALCVCLLLSLLCSLWISFSLCVFHQHTSLNTTAMAKCSLSFWHVFKKLKNRVCSHQRQCFTEIRFDFCVRLICSETCEKTADGMNETFIDVCVGLNRH